MLHHFLNHYAARFKKSITGVSPDALRLICAHDFPGNVRELKNIMEFAVMVCTGDTILVEHLPGHLPGVLDTGTPPRTLVGRKSPRKNV